MFHSGPVQKIWSVRFSFFLERNSIKLLKSDFYMFQINVFLNNMYLGYHRILRSTTMLYCDNKKDFMRMIGYMKVHVTLFSCRLFSIQ